MPQQFHSSAEGGRHERFDDDGARLLLLNAGILPMCFIQNMLQTELDIVLVSDGR